MRGDDLIAREVLSRRDDTRVIKSVQWFDCCLPMSQSCCSPAPSIDPVYRRVLWIALSVNAVMFLVEVMTGLVSGSVSLLADAIDFFGDAGNYAISLAVLAMSSRVRAQAALLKAGCMAALGIFVLARAVWSARTGVVPEPATMGAVALVALVANAGVAALLYRFRAGDSNMRSVWICSCNDALGNIAVALAAWGVFGTGSALPDLAVAAVMAVLALSGSAAVFKQARFELGRSAAGIG